MFINVQLTLKNIYHIYIPYLSDKLLNCHNLFLYSCDVNFKKSKIHVGYHYRYERISIIIVNVWTAYKICLFKFNYKFTLLRMVLQSSKLKIPSVTNTSIFRMK